MAPRNEARTQYTIGLHNRRVAAKAANRNRLFASADRGDLRLIEFLCTCGRDGCSERVLLSLREHRYVAASPHRMVVAPGHAAEMRRGTGARAPDVLKITLWRSTAASTCSRRCST